MGLVHAMAELGHDTPWTCSTPPIARAIHGGLVHAMAQLGHDTPDNDHDAAREFRRKSHNWFKAHPGKYEITAYSTWKDPVVEHDGVRYVRWDDLKDYGECDVFFAYYDVRALHGIQKPLRIGSHHTISVYPGFPFIDVNTAPSQWTVDLLKKCARGHSPWEVLPNAVEGLEHIEHKPVPGRVIYQTSPDRGLHLLLEVWPDIIARVPHATLHVTGDPHGMYRGFGGREYERSCEGQWARRLVAGVQTAKAAGGVTFHGRVSRDKMHDILSEAACFAFPAHVYSPCETFSISILECLTVGVPVVLSPADALKSVWAEHVALMPETTAPYWREQFVEGVCHVLENETWAQSLSKAGKEHAKTYSFQRSAAALDAMIEKYLPIYGKVA